MPYTISTFQLPSGSSCVRVEWHGIATAEDARGVIEQLGLSQHQGLPILAVSYDLDALTAEARAVFGNFGQERWLARVATNPSIRVAVKFIMRTNKNPRQKMFDREEEAIQWLDERAREDATKEKPGPP